MLKAVKFAPLLALAVLFGCGEGDGGGGGSAPVINSFSANPTSVAAGQSVQLTWDVSGNPTSLSIDNGIGTVSGTNRTVTPTATTTYNLTASNSSGQSATASTTVTVGGTPPPPSGNKSVSFGVSADQTGPFESDTGTNITTPSDPRVLNVAAGSTFYAQVVYSGPNPVTGVTIYLANQSPENLEADLVPGTAVGGFTIGAALPGCTVDGTATSVTCVYPITVAPGTPNITGLPGVVGEFAYVFRTKIADTAGGLPYQEPPRGYVTVGSGGGTPAPTPPAPTPPAPTPPAPTPPGPTPTAPTINSFTANPTTINSSQTSTLTWSISGTVTSLSINNGVGDVSGTTETVGPDSTTTYTLTARNGSATATRQTTVTVTGGTTPTGPFVLTVSKTGNGTGNVTSSPAGISCGTGTDCTESFPANAGVLLTAVPTSPSTFGGFSGGGCSGPGLTCQVTMNAAKTVQATFNPPSTSPGLNAEAGPGSKAGTVGTPVELNGSASTGATGPSAYRWTVVDPNGMAVVVSGFTRAVASFTPSAAVQYIATLTVSNGTTTDTDTININVSNTATPEPVADAGDDRETSVNQGVTLDGTASQPQGTVTYSWTQTKGPAGGALTNANTATATFSSPNTGIYTFQLTVSNSAGSDSDTVLVEIE